MNISEIIETKGAEVVTIKDESTVCDAIAMLVRNKIGALLVLDGESNIVGIISERDILTETCRSNGDFKEAVVGDVMTRDVIIGRSGDDLDYVEHVMTQNRIRHLPVLEGKKLVGIVSIGDVVKANMTASEVENRYLMDYIKNGYPG